MAAAGAFGHCRRLVAEHDKERFWATLYAPAEHRDHLYALYAFDHEIARIPHVVREPMASEIRRQWWREVVEGERDEEAKANPVSAALLDTIRKYDLAPGRLIGVIDAQGEDDGEIVAFAAQILGRRDEAVEHIARHAALARSNVRAGNVVEARRHLDTARNLLRETPTGILPALLPFAADRASLEKPLPRWRRQWLIWRAARDPRRIFG